MVPFSSRAARNLTWSAPRSLAVLRSASWSMTASLAWGIQAHSWRISAGRSSGTVTGSAAEAGRAAVPEWVMTSSAS